MSSAKLAAVLCIAAFALSACSGSVAVKPGAGTGSSLPPSSHARLDDPRVDNPDRIACLKAAGLPVQEFGRTGIQIGPRPAGPTITFAPSPGAALGDQVEGLTQGAEVIGAALLYPNQGSSHELSKIESCLDQGVTD